MAAADAADIIRAVGAECGGPLANVGCGLNVKGG